MYPVGTPQIKVGLWIALQETFIILGETLVLEVSNVFYGIPGSLGESWNTKEKVASSRRPHKVSRILCSKKVIKARSLVSKNQSR